MFDYAREHFEALKGPPYELSDWPPWDYTEEEEHPMSELSHVCPVCGGVHVHADWQSPDNPESWYAGHYVCLSCHTCYDASGRILNGYPIIRTWHPACPQHGTEQVIMSDRTGRHFYCCRCSRKLEVRSGKVIVTWQPPVRQQAVAA